MDAVFFTLMSRYFWAICLGVNTLNAVILWLRSRPYRQQNPALTAGYVTLTRGYWIVMTLPWVAMGYGVLVGGVPSIWHFLYPSSGNPYVLAWRGVYWLTIIFVMQWDLLRGGAEMMASYPGFLRGNPKNPKHIKLFWLLMVAGSATFTVVMFNQPAPEFSPVLGAF